MAGYHDSIPVYSLVINIVDYGGSDNGTISNDGAVQNAISSLNNQDGIIYFPAGTFLFKVPIELRSGLVLKGESAANTLLNFYLSGSGSLITVAGTATAVVTNITSPAFKDEISFTADDASLFTVYDYIKIY